MTNDLVEEKTLTTLHQRKKSEGNTHASIYHDP